MCIYCRINLSLCPSGGVYDSAEAKLYWEKRFGNLFADLATIQVTFSREGQVWTGQYVVNSFIWSEESHVPATVSCYIRGTTARTRSGNGTVGQWGEGGGGCNHHLHPSILRHLLPLLPLQHTAICVLDTHQDWDCFVSMNNNDNNNNDMPPHV